MWILKNTHWYRWLFPGAIWRIKNAGNAIYLTFDDGPTPGVTDAVLDILDDFGAKATFFLIGEELKAHPETARATLARGHRLGTHSWSHPYGFSTPHDRYMEDIGKGHKVFAEELGFEPEIFRPPYGKIRPRAFRELKKRYKIVMWEVLAGDFYDELAKEPMLEKLRENTAAGSVVVFHDSQKCAEKILWALPRYLDFCKKKGFTFELIP